MDSLKLILVMLFHPSDAFLLIKRRRDKASLFPALILLTLFVAVRIISIYITHFPLADVDPAKASFPIEAAMMIVPILTWTLSIYAVTAIMGGEMTLPELATVNAYCLLPYIVFTLPVSVLSTVLSGYESALFTGLNIICLVWILILLFSAIKMMNNYSFFAAVGVCAIGIIGMFLIWCVVILLTVFTTQFFSFLQSLLIEYRMTRL